MQKPTIVILGTGFAAVSLIRNLDTKAYNVIVVSPRNHFLFTPLLPSTTVGTIEFRSIIEPIRKTKNKIQYYNALCISILPEESKILCEDVSSRNQFTIEYDELVIAVGAINNTFDIPGVDENAYFLRELNDARRIRNKIIENMEYASNPVLTDEERRRLLTFMIVGGGPTGVEVAAELHDFVTEDLIDVYPNLAKKVSILLLEATENILSTFDAKLAEYAMKLFRRQNIQVRTGSVVTKVEKGKVHLNDESVIEYGLLVWSTGNAQTPLVRSLPFTKNEIGRLITGSYLQVKGYENIYAIGDCATMEGNNFPATAQVAMQEGKYLARTFNKKIKHKKIKPFVYKHFGMLAYIGSNRALADLPKIKGKGFSTWFFWRSAYLTKLVSLKNKILVLFDWFKAFVFGRDVSSF